MAYTSTGMSTYLTHSQTVTAEMQLCHIMYSFEINIEKFGNNVENT
jgi:hypothetical protein